MNTVDEFHKLFYKEGDEIYGKVRYKGIPIQKNPLDLWVYQEIMWEYQPQIIIETGSLYGGSALYLADLAESMNLSCDVYSIDINSYDYPQHDRLNFITGNSVDAGIITPFYNRTRDKRVIVILDSDHSYQHVTTEITEYAPIIPVGGYLIVEDTNLNGNPIRKDWGKGPKEAVEDFLFAFGNMFEIDKSREKFLMTFNPGGYLKRIR